MCKAEGSGIEIHCRRDLTRGGLASALVEISEAATGHMAIEERAIAVPEDVRGAGDMLGVAPIYVANEGRFVCFVPASEAEQALSIFPAHTLGTAAAQIDTVTTGSAPMVLCLHLVMTAI